MERKKYNADQNNLEQALIKLKEEELITSLLSLGYVLHLIPHVIENDNDKLDGDVQICSELYKKYKCSNL